MSLVATEVRRGDSLDRPNLVFETQQSELDSARLDYVTPAAAPCAHCGSKVPESRRAAEGELQFCCGGCAAVFHVLESAGLEDYYAYRERLGEVSGPALVGDRENYSEFDSASYQQLYCSQNEDGSVSTSFVLEGVHCAACVWLVERVGRVQPAVRSARLDISQARVDLIFDPQEAPLSRVARDFERLGYLPRPFRAQEAERARRRELRALLLRIGIAGASAGNVMLMAFALYSGATGIDEAGTMDGATRHFFEWASLIVSLPALWAASVFFRGAVAALRTRTAHMDLPIALGIAGGFVWGTYGVLSGRGQIYFDSITALVFFLLVGRYIQRRHQMAHSEAAELVHAVLPSTALLVLDHPTGEIPHTREVPRDELTPATLVYVKSGATVPVDGIVTSGKSTLDKSLLSGESRPESVEPGSTVEAGALNLGQGLVVEATGSGAETRVARLMEEVQRALCTKTPLTGQANKIAGMFTVAVIGLALLVAGLWWQTSKELAVERALSLLIVACPCALGLATPLALSAAVRKAAEVKRLVFAPEALEQLGHSCNLVLDKTGTLTRGRLRVLHFEGDRSILPVVERMEAEARHPVAQALREFSETSQGSVETIENVVELNCQGLVAEMREKRVAIGSERLLAELGVSLPESFMRSFSAARPAGASPIFVAQRDQVVGAFWVGDEIRPDAASSLMALKKRGHRLHLLSGDHPTTVADVALVLSKTAGDENLFSSVVGGVSPEEKLNYINELKLRPSKQAERRPVVMVGDGINDAGALAAADVGIAVDGAAEASRLSAQVYLPLSGVSELLALTSGAQRTLATIRRGIVFSLSYNAVGITCAAMGLLGPLEAAVLMPLSSLTVVTNAYRSRSFLPAGRSQS